MLVLECCFDTMILALCSISKVCTNYYLKMGKKYEQFRGGGIEMIQCFMGLGLSWGSIIMGVMCLIKCLLWRGGGSRFIWLWVLTCSLDFICHTCFATILVQQLHNPEWEKVINQMISVHFTTENQTKTRETKYNYHNSSPFVQGSSKCWMVLNLH